MCRNNIKTSYQIHTENIKSFLIFLVLWLCVTRKFDDAIHIICTINNSAEYRSRNYNYVEKVLSSHLSSYKFIGSSEYSHFDKLFVRLAGRKTSRELYISCLKIYFKAKPFNIYSRENLFKNFCKLKKIFTLRSFISKYSVIDKDIIQE